MTSFISLHSSDHLALKNNTVKRLFFFKHQFKNHEIDRFNENSSEGIFWIFTIYYHLGIFPNFLLCPVG
jgi:hypothetical protein